LDLTVPGGDGGKEAIGKLLSSDPNAKVIVISGYSDDPVLSDYRRYGFAGMLAKPFRAEALVGLVQSLSRPSAPGVCYTTDFALDEKPISEGGAWTHVGLDWAVVQTTGGNAFGTQTGNDGYDDSYAHLSGFPPDVTVSATICRAGGIPAGDVHEVELLLRWADAAHDARGYECLLHHAGNYAEIVRWEGALGSFTYLARGKGAAPKTGDVLKATIVGNVITMYLNDVQLVQATDSTFATGDPGIGFFRRATGTNTLFGFSSFSARAL
jgi:CheY-like chemotaxis protein